MWAARNTHKQGSSTDGKPDFCEQQFHIYLISPEVQLWTEVKFYIRVIKKPEAREMAKYTS